MNEQFDAGREAYIDKLREENERMRKALKEAQNILNKLPLRWPDVNRATEIINAAYDRDEALKGGDK